MGTYLLDALFKFIVKPFDNSLSYGGYFGCTNFQILRYSLGPCKNKGTIPSYVSSSILKLKSNNNNKIQKVEVKWKTSLAAGFKPIVLLEVYLLDLLTLFALYFIPATFASFQERVDILQFTLQNRTSSNKT